jgi:V8-like Glu-specific endopeptidase
LELKSVSKPTGEAAVAVKKPEPVTERRISVASDKAVAQTRTTIKRLAVGKSDRPMVSTTAQGLRLETVLHPTDERTRIVETDEAPWRMVCALEIDGPWGSFLGTGWLVAPRTIITAGHCVYDARQMGGWANKISIAPGRDAVDRPYGTLESTKFSTTDVWLQKQDPDFDISAIHLAEPIGDQVGWFQVASLTDDQLRGYLVNVSGYPAQPGEGTQQWWAKNRIREVTPRRIFYEVDTSGGQSGAPVYIIEKNGAPPMVVGIHAYGVGGTPQSIPLQVNSAPRIIPEVVAQIEKWIAQDNVS